MESDELIGDPKLILYNGEKFFQEETETEVILTQLEPKHKQRRVVLVFTKDEEESNRNKAEFAKMIKKKIIDDYYQSKKNSSL